MDRISIDKILNQNQFSSFEWIESRLSIADLFKPDNRCGIYIIRFKNDEYYVGQAIDVTRRFIQHTKNHDDIKEIAFQVVLKDKLNEIEQHNIKILEFAGAKLRNISLTSYPKGESDLDLIISKKEQEDFIKTTIEYKLQPPIIHYPDIQRKYTKKFNRLLKHKDFNGSILPFLKLYLSKCIIQPEKTELSFWSLTCLTKAFLDADNIALCRINLFWCEVLCIWINDNGDVMYTFHLTKTLLPKSYLKSIKISYFKKQLTGIIPIFNTDNKIKTLIYNDHYYIRGGPDQFTIEVNGVNDAIKLLSNDKVVAAIKTFNLRQMQKGATVYSKYHCLDLTRYLLTN